MFLFSSDFAFGMFDFELQLVGLGSSVPAGLYLLQKRGQFDDLCHYSGVPFGTI
jgi:hypothetical protein